MKKNLLWGFTFSALLFTSSLAGHGLEMLPFNNPEGTVDLAVGLWAFPMVIDYDGDGDLDLVIASPNTPSRGTCFFENPTPRGEKNPMPIFKPARKISDMAFHNTTLTYTAGKPVVTVHGRVVWNFKKDFYSKLTEIKGVKRNIHPKGVRGNCWRFADYNGDGRDDLIISVGDWSGYGWDNSFDANGIWQREKVHGYTYWIPNVEGQGEKARYGKPRMLTLPNGKPLDVEGNPMSMLEDWDGDGDLDILCGEFVDGFTYFENVGTRQSPKYAEGVRLRSSGGRLLAMDLQMITPSAVDWDGDGNIDLICGDEDGRVAWIQNTGKKNGGIPIFEEPKYFRQEMDSVYTGGLSTPCGCDWDGDGDWDIISGNSAGYIVWVENLSGKGVAHPRWAEPVRLKADGETIRIQAGINGSIQGPIERKWGYTTLTVADWDGDGLPDIMANSIWGDVIWYRNCGTRTRPKLSAARPVEVEWRGEQPALAWGWRKPKGKALLTQWRTTPVMFDWNHDSLMDLVMLDQEGYLCLFARKLENGKRILQHPQRIFYDFGTKKPLHLNHGKAGASGRRKICLADWNGDGETDLIVNGINARLLLQVQSENGKHYFQDLGKMDSRRLEGHTASPTVVDFDDNGQMDLLIGAEDGYFYYLHNDKTLTGTVPATPRQPQTIPIVFQGGSSPESVGKNMAYQKSHARTLRD